jgi:hypothetical protein
MTAETVFRILIFRGPNGEQGGEVPAPPLMQDIRFGRSSRKKNGERVFFEY